MCAEKLRVMLEPLPEQHLGMLELAQQAVLVRQRNEVPTLRLFLVLTLEFSDLRGQHRGGASHDLA